MYTLTHIQTRRYIPEMRLTYNTIRNFTFRNLHNERLCARISIHAFVCELYNGVERTLIRDRKFPLNG